MRGRWVRVSPRLCLLIGRFLATAINLAHAPLRIEPDDHVRTFVNRPDVVAAVDSDGVRKGPAVQVLADLADELAVRPEFKELCGSRAVGRTGGAVRAREDEQVSLRVHRNAGDFAEVHPVGELEEVRDRVELELPYDVPLAGVHGWQYYGEYQDEPEHEDVHGTSTEAILAGGPASECRSYCYKKVLRT